mmetsp:Transcript_1406/g.4766  ORF Transcript_1406/g.4766 Transcript_1406/m.4766 type:complete len:284 (+) Transcript_1406:77-928(+)
MSLQDFRAIFRRETDSALARLQQKSFERSRLRSTEVSPASVGIGAAGSPATTAELGTSALGPELAHAGELQRLAADMAESILERVSRKTAGLADLASGGALPDEPAAALALRRAAEAEGAAARERRRTRLQELEAELRRKRAEEAQVRAKLVARCKADNELGLQAQEEQLAEIRGRAASCMEGSEDPRKAAQLQQEFAEHVARIHSNMSLTRDAVSRLEARQAALERVEGQQRKPQAPVEALLARAVPGGGVDPMDDLDSPLVGAIRRGEQVCKRMRRSLAGA